MSDPHCPRCYAPLGGRHDAKCSSGHWGQVLPSEIPGYVESVAREVLARGVVVFPCRHGFQQQRDDRTVLPCPWPGCSRGQGVEENDLGRTITDGGRYERRVTGGGETPLVYLWKRIDE